jgi:tetratricopeptide (TPR) repeat protein
MMRKLFFVLTVIGCTALSSTGGSFAAPPPEQPGPLTFTLSPGAVIPVGESSALYTLGFGLGLCGEYRLARKPLFFLSGDAGFTQSPVQAETGLSIFSLGGGGGVRRELGRKLSVRGFLNGGGYYAFLNDANVEGETSALNPYFAAGGGLYYGLSKSLNAGIELSYRSYVGLYNGIGISLGTSYSFGGEKARRGEQPLRVTPLAGDHVELLDVEFSDVFPVFFKYYDDHTIGRATLKCLGDGPVTDVKVDLMVKQYMDSAKECASFAELAAGGELSVELRALFTERVLEITEGTKVAADVTVQYKYKGEPYVYEKVATLSLYDRNATRWDDDRKAAAFVTAKDPSVLRLAKNTAGIVKEHGIRSVNENLRTAMALHEALALYGVSYVVDPATPYTEYSKDAKAIDYLQFPRQTLEYRAGDCDDLSILYSALLESVGIETAFITTPGHIYLAFSAGIDPREGKASFSKAGDLVFFDDKTWVPFEVTSTSDGFVKAWELGARLWREASGAKLAGFYPVREAWNTYNPVGLPGEGASLNYPLEDKVRGAYLKELAKFVNGEIAPQVVRLEEEIRKSGGSAALVNKLGVLYAKYGLYDKAEREFGKILNKSADYVPALLNMGNIHFLREDSARAREYYEKAAAREPENPKAVLCMARLNHKMENYGTAKTLYAKLKALDPGLASQFAYLDMRGEEAARAADASKAKEAMVWSD